MISETVMIRANEPQSRGVTKITAQINKLERKQ